MKTPGLRKGSRPGQWHLSVCVPGTSGKARKRKTVIVENRAEALAEWSAFRREIVARGGRAKAWTLASYVEAHQDGWASASAHGARDFKFRCSVLVRELGPDIRLDRINAAIVRELAARLLKRYKPITVNGVLAGLRRLLRDAVDRSALAVYPIRGRLPLQRVEPLRLEMSDEERAAFLSGFDDEQAFRRRIAQRRVARISDAPQTGLSLPGGKEAGVEWYFHRALKPVYVVALETGLSRADLLALEWPDVEGPIIRTTRVKTGVGAVVPITPACRAALDELKARPLVGKRVFVSPGTGKPLAIDTLNQHWKLGKELAGITRRLRFHDLRHTFASRLASAGVSLQVIARALGHTSIAMSQRYARPSDESMRAVVDALATNSNTNTGNRSNGVK